MTTYNGWTESEHNTKARTSRTNWKYACVKQDVPFIHENEADDLHAVIKFALTDPEHDRYSPEAEQEHQAADAKDLLDTQEGARY